ncbi:MAG: hypothetical protein EP338_09010 [Bacteroidetes bacterium]|nr:MAG: hypothetical protein EP338_09010 [Bacteroidota bacterium]
MTAQTFISDTKVSMDHNTMMPKTQGCEGAFNIPKWHSDYSYGFQNQERDDEIKGEGNSWNYKYRMQDSRLGRFLSLDPLAPKYPEISPYVFSENRLIDGVEFEGLEVQLVTQEQVPGNAATSGVPMTDISITQYLDNSTNVRQDMNIVNTATGARETNPNEVLTIQKNQTGNIQDPTPGDGVPNLGTASATMDNISRRMMQIANSINSPGRNFVVGDNSLSAVGQAGPGGAVGNPVVVGTGTPPANTRRQIFQGRYLAATGVLQGGGQVGNSNSWTQGQGNNLGTLFANVGNGANNAALNNITIDIVFNTNGANNFTNAVIGTLNAQLGPNYANVTINPVYAGDAPASNQFFGASFYLTP